VVLACDKLCRLSAGPACKPETLWRLTQTGISMLFKLCYMGCGSHGQTFAVCHTVSRAYVLPTHTAELLLLLLLILLSCCAGQGWCFPEL
jgi:hypothetical protein